MYDAEHFYFWIISTVVNWHTNNSNVKLQSLFLLIFAREFQIKINPKSITSLAPLYYGSNSFGSRNREMMSPCRLAVRSDVTQEAREENELMVYLIRLPNRSLFGRWWCHAEWKWQKSELLVNDSERRENSAISDVSTWRIYASHSLSSWCTLWLLLFLF